MYCNLFLPDFQVSRKKTGAVGFPAAPCLLTFTQQNPKGLLQIQSDRMDYWVTFAHSAFHLSRMAGLLAVRYGTSRFAQTISSDGFSQAFSGTL